MLRGDKRFKDDKDPVSSVFPEDTGFYLEVDLDYPQKVRYFILNLKTYYFLSSYMTSIKICPLHQKRLI